MRNIFVLFATLAMLALVSVACAPQDAVNAPGDVTALATTSTDSGTATNGAGEAAMTPTGALEGSTPTQGAGESGTTPTAAADSATPVQGAAGTAVIPQTGGGEAGAPDDLDELVRVLRTAGATVEIGDTVEQDFVSVAGQIIRINGEEVQIFIYGSAEELEAQASQIPDRGDSEDEPHFYKLGNMLLRYVGRDPGVRDLLEDVLGADAAGR